ncbi:MAG: endopeptidase La [Chloroflexi bacterium]|nr:endopeptidase La [Chloroflexota bacterium]
MLEEYDRAEAIKIPEILPVLPVKDSIVFPYIMVPLLITGEKWTRLVSEAASTKTPIAVFGQPRPEDEPDAKNLFWVGTLANVLKILKLPDGGIQALIRGFARARLQELTKLEPFFQGRIEPLKEVVEGTAEIQAMDANLRSLFQRIVSLAPNLPTELATTAEMVKDPGRLADFVASSLNLGIVEKQDLLETLDISERLMKVTAFAYRQLDILEIGSRIQARVREQMEKSQRDYYLREQMLAIRRELGEEDEREIEAEDYRDRIEKAALPEEARKEAERELDRLIRTPSGSPDHGIIRTYLDWLTALPWSRSTEDVLNIGRAKEILDEDHYDLEKVKDRILEYVAVRQLSRELKGPIFCFVGPPGVGKTSLGQSIARALDRKFIRVSLGGVRDESEIRGHRRTYIGALPGRIIQGIRRAGPNNPVFMLDEVDKLSIGFQGDPAAALLEVLDPAQNHAFVDNYLGVPFDLSRVLFIATANFLDPIPPALRDRLEVLELPGYTEYEKVQIAKRFLVPKQLAAHGLTPEQMDFTDPALRLIIQGYTREAGVRNVEREIANICRKVARSIAEGKELRPIISRDRIDDFLGPRRFRYEAVEAADEVGVATALAWTPVGGDILFVEARAVPGRGNLILTGQLGDVMRESARAGLTYARSRSEALQLPESFHERFDIHIHVPAGAIPKDGPSAGITMAVAMISALNQHPVRKEVGMTGEITLRGKVLPVGGIRDKVLAAHRAGVRAVILPRDNQKDLVDIPARVKEDLQFVLVEHMDEVLNVALVPRQVEEVVEVEVAAAI